MERRSPESLAVEALERDVALLKRMLGAMALAQDAMCKALETSQANLVQLVGVVERLVARSEASEFAAPARLQ